MMVTACGWKLKAWEKANFGNISKCIRSLRDDLQWLMPAYLSMEVLEKKKSVFEGNHVKTMVPNIVAVRGGCLTRLIFTKFPMVEITETK